jgi:hypothetical protein
LELEKKLKVFGVGGIFEARKNLSFSKLGKIGDFWKR